MAQRVEKVFNHLKCILTESETLTAARELAKANSERAELESAKSAVTKDFSAKIAGREADIQRLSGLVSNGYEFRRVECRIQYNYPSPGEKTTSRNDTGEIIETAMMTADEKQETLQLDEDSEGEEWKDPA